MFEVGDIVKIRPEWRNPKEDPHDRYIVTEVNDHTKRVHIKELNPHLFLPCVEVVGYEMIETVAAERYVFTVCFVRKDGKPVEEYEYHSLDDAEKHFDLFLRDDSDLYSRIDLTETRIGLPEVTLKTMRFDAKQVDETRLKEYIEDEKILEFSSTEECMDFFNTQDGQSLKSVDEMKKFQAQYGFEHNGKWHHILFEEALDVWTYCVEIKEKE